LPSFALQGFVEVCVSVTPDVDEIELVSPVVAVTLSEFVAPPPPNLVSTSTPREIATDQAFEFVFALPNETLRENAKSCDGPVCVSAKTQFPTTFSFSAAGIRDVVSNDFSRMELRLGVSPKHWRYFDCA